MSLLENFIKMQTIVKRQPAIRRPRQIPTQELYVVNPSFLSQRIIRESLARQNEELPPYSIVDPMFPPDYTMIDTSLFNF